MNVWIDADGCPVVDITVKLCESCKIECMILCDTAHRIERGSAQTIVLDKGSDSVDFALANKVQSGDLVITQDYGLASMCLARSARVLHQDGWEYTRWNIDALLLQRYESKRYRASGGRLHGAPKRTIKQNQAFSAALEAILKENQTVSQG